MKLVSFTEKITFCGFRELSQWLMDLPQGGLQPQHLMVDSPRQQFVLEPLHLRDRIKISSMRGPNYEQ